jgi:ferredoxin
MKFVKENCIQCWICTTTDYVTTSDDGDKIVKENLTKEQKNELKEICPTGAFEE